MESKRVLKREGLNLVVDKETLDDQRILEVGTEVPDKAKVDDKEEFENYKVLYKGAIDDKCIELYGSCDDDKLWEDTAKELYLSSKNYIPEADKKADGELVDEKEPVKESRRVIKHNKITEAIELTDKDKEILRQKAYDMFKTSKKFKNDEKGLNDYLDNEVMPLWYEAQSNLGQHVTESKKLNEVLDEEELNDLYNYLSEMKTDADNLYDKWVSVPDDTREKLDDMFNEKSVSFYIRWLTQALDDLLDYWEDTKTDLNKVEESKKLKKVIETKECSKQD